MHKEEKDWGMNWLKCYKINKNIWFVLQHINPFPGNLMPNSVIQLKGKHKFGLHKNPKGRHRYSKLVDLFSGVDPSVRECSQYILDLK